MSQTFEKIRALVLAGKARISAHGYDELDKDGILYADVLDGLAAAFVVEDYPTASKGPSVLMLQQDSVGRPLHVLWGIPDGETEPAVVVTAYRPNPARWTADFRSRKK